MWINEDLDLVWVNQWMDGYIWKQKQESDVPNNKQTQITIALSKKPRY